MHEEKSDVKYAKKSLEFYEESDSNFFWSWSSYQYFGQA